MQPKRNDRSRLGFFGELTMGLFNAPGTGPRQPQEWPGVGGDMKLKPRPTAGDSSYRSSGRLIGRKALVTRAETGTGRAAALAFAREGADVAFTFLPAGQSDAEDVAQLIRQAGRNAVPLPGDLRDENSCNQLVADTVRALGGVDILVTNLTRQFQSIADIAQMSTEQFDATFKSNIYAMFWLTKAALPHMGPGSSIINTSCGDRCDRSDILLDYSATKGAIMLFTKSLAKQLASRGIRVNAVAPQPIWTPVRTSDDPPADQPTGIAADSCAAVGAHQAELASTYVLLASDESSYATGQLYSAVGGNGP